MISPWIARWSMTGAKRLDVLASGDELKTSIVTSHRHGDAGVASVIHNGAHLFVISSRRGDSRKQRTGHGGAEQKAIRSTTVRLPLSRSRGGVAASRG
jgi:hypothetical protein